MQYYQVDGNNADDDSEEDDLSHDEKGVKGHYEGSHSPFGMIYQIARDAGWSVEYVLKQPYARLMMMLQDAPRYVKGSKEKPIHIRSEQQLRDALGGGKTPNERI